MIRRFHRRPIGYQSAKTGIEDGQIDWGGCIGGGKTRGLRVGIAQIKAFEFAMRPTRPASCRGFF
jgi:hypothetical protein